MFWFLWILFDKVVHYFIKNGVFPFLFTAHDLGWDSVESDQLQERHQNRPNMSHTDVLSCFPDTRYLLSEANLLSLPCPLVSMTDLLPSWNLWMMSIGSHMFYFSTKCLCYFRLGTNHCRYLVNFRQKTQLVCFGKWLVQLGFQTTHELQPGSKSCL